MLKKFVSIKNVGRFRNSAAAGNPQLAKHTFIVGANGFGKTTICAVLRSLHTGDPSHVLGRRTLGVADEAAVDLLLDTCLARFHGAAWTTTHPVAVFDGAFVAENVHSGDAVEIDHKRNLYRVIIGDDGVRLAEEDARLAGESRAKTSEMSAAARAIQPHVPAGMQLNAFIVLSAVADIDAKIATLALAFFLAHLERDKELARKIVVFDDPLNSQDTFRRRQTVHEIMKVAGQCAQVIVLSHDATFLKQVWDKAPAAERISLTIADHRAQGSKLMPIDLEKACQGRTATDIDDLQTYLTTGAGNLLDIIRKMRVVLETYCCTTYPTCFQAGQDWLGDIVRKTREGGATHPMLAHYDELGQINDYTSQYHHGEDVADVTPDQIDPTELTGYTRRTLKIVNALQA
jgi:wobble nucleotide-excising tRNase